MARLQTLTPFGAQIIAVLLDDDTVYALPDSNALPPFGTTFEIFDNLGIGQNVTIAGPFAASDSITVSGVSGWMMRFTWAGNFYAVG